MATRSRLTGIDFVAAERGTLFINDTNEHTGTFAGIWINEDATEIDQVKDENGNDITAALGLGSGEIINKGMIVRHGGKNLSSITLGAGSAQVILG